MQTPVPDQAGLTGQELRRDWAQSAPWLLRRASRRYGSVVGAHLRDANLAGLPRQSYWLLMALASGARDATRLVEAIGISKQAVSKVLDTLVDGGFVARATNEEDRRRTDLVLTAKGLRTVDVIRSAVRAAERAFVGEVGDAAWETTIATLAVLAREERDDRVEQDEGRES